MKNRFLAQRNIFLLSLLLIYPCFSPPALPDETVYTIDPIVITASRIKRNFLGSDRSITVINPNQIRRFPVHSISDAISLAPGVDTRRRGNGDIQSDWSIRGSSFEQVLLLVDGVPMNDPQTGHFISDIPMEMSDIERIEILRGHGSSSFGSGAFGGVIHVITKKPERFATDFQTSLGDFSTRTAGFRGEMGNKRHGGSFSINWKSSRGDKTNRDINRLNLFTSMQFHGKNSTQYHLSGGILNKNFGAESFYAPFPSRESTSTRLVNFSFRKEAGRTLVIQGQGGWRRHRDRFVLNRWHPENYRNHHLTHIYTTNFEAVYSPAGQIIYLGGIEGGYDTIESIGYGRSQGLGSHRRGHAAIFLEAARIGQLFWLISLRSNRDTYGTLFHPSIGGGLWLTPATKFRLSAGQGHRIPTYTELFYEDPANRGNPHLKPEKSMNFEAGIEWYTAFMRTTFGGFVRHERNPIDWVRFPEQTFWTAGNMERRRVTGLETALFFNEGREKSFFVHYAAVASRLKRTDEYESKYLLRHPVHHVSVGGVYPLPFGVELATVLQVKKRRSDNPYHTLDVKLTRQLKRITVYGEITNLSGTNYEENPGVPAPGRWAYTGIELNGRP